MADILNKYIAHELASYNKVIINGTAEFIRDNERVSFVSACDIYEFNDKNQIQNIKHE